MGESNMFMDIVQNGTGAEPKWNNPQTSRVPIQYKDAVLPV